MIDTSTIAGHGDQVRSLVKQVIIDTTPQTAWQGWASADGLTAWWNVPETNIDLRVGGAFELFFMSDGPPGQRGSEGCQYLGYVPGEMISFTWNAPPHLVRRTTNTWVAITFTAMGDNTTLVRLVHTGFLEGPDWDQYMAYFDTAWSNVLDLQMRHHAE